MKFVSVVLSILSLFLYSSPGYAQRSAYSIGMKGSFGMPVPDPKTSLDINGQAFALRTHAYYSGGILGQYVLGDAIGIETGILNTYSSYSRKDLTGAYLLQSLGWDANIGVNSYQIPIQFMYIFRLRTHPGMKIKLTGGIAMDWLTAGFLKRQENPLLVSSILGGVRIKARTGKYGRIEYGLEYQHSLKGHYSFAMQTDKGTNTLHSGFSVLSVHLYYFFLNRNLSEHPKK